MLLDITTILLGVAFCVLPPAQGIACTVCKEYQGSGSDEGCTDPNIKTSITSGCHFCVWSICAKSQTINVIMPDGAQVMMPFSKGAMAMKECYFLDPARPSPEAGKCIWDGYFGYHCYCAENMCNAGNPPSSWLRAANLTDPDVLRKYSSNEEYLSATKIKYAQCSSALEKVTAKLAEIQQIVLRP